MKGFIIKKIIINILISCFLFSITTFMAYAQNKMPGIVGSQAYDVILSLEKHGIKKPTTQNNNDGYTWNSQLTNVYGVNFSYTIVANKKHEIASASYYALQSTDAKDFLVFCASMPYKNSNIELAKSFVIKNIGKNASITIGDAIFELIYNKGNTILIIRSTGFDDYVMSLF